MLHSNSSPPLQSLLQRTCSPLKQQSSTMNGASSAQDSYFIFDELSTALPERNNNNNNSNNSDGSSKIIGNNSNFSNKSSSSIGSSIGGSNTSTATNLSSTFQRPQFGNQQQQQQQQRLGFGEF
ncbi:hypothetical protein PVAND_003502 [Polypedilum vanderplanki]|uniref:Uncharacterized protein n=1 Tax=Polypedilum vanderplanki TaxID=319348 RepID=A0A9J6BUR2_POLVA|nr:hypothetical protein PVAND_003502 [Polypedilum vanderplanki]